MERSLFPIPDQADSNVDAQSLPRNAAAASKGAPRIKRADRKQRRLLPVSLDALVAEDHQVRAVWAYVEEMDLSALYERYRAVDGRPGRSAIDPQILFALWIYATLDGVGSARHVDRLCVHHGAYMWICGGVSVNYHTLSDFRSQNPHLLEQLMVDSVAVLRHEGLVDLQRVAQDGIRVRASAGAASFRRESTLETCLEEAEQQVERLRKELEEDPAAGDRRRKAAQQRAAEERVSRVKKALEEVKDVRARRKREKENARASTTDPQARVMKMPDGGYRPAYNGQFAVDTKSQIIVGVDVSNSGGDMGKLAPMVEKIQELHGEAPKEILVDGGFAKKEDVDKVSAEPANCTVYAPAPKQPGRKEDGSRPQQRRPDSPAVAEWRKRMQTDEAKTIYKERASTVECVNGIARNRGLQRFLVRGIPKVKSVLLWFALAHNIARTIVLRASTEPTVAVAG